MHSYEYICYEYIYYARLKILADVVIVHIGHFIKDTKILGSYMAVQYECQKRTVGRF